MKVIINADDFGLSEGVNLGILEAITNGIVTSTTMIANLNGFEHALRIIKQNAALSVGVHLILTQGKPITQGLTTIVDERGQFFNQEVLRTKLNHNKINLDEVEREYTAQINKLIKCGIYPTHMDSHHHMHLLPGVFEIALKLARHYNIPIRLYDRTYLLEGYRDIKSVDRFYADFYDQNISSETIINVIEENTDKVIEIMSHPAYIDRELQSKSAYIIQRRKELDVLKNKELKKYLLAKGVQLINYSEI